MTRAKRWRSVSVAASAKLEASRTAKVMNKRLRTLGYRQVTLLTDCILGARGDQLRGHEFHYSDIENKANSSRNREKHRRLYTLDNNSHEGYSVGSALGSYVHLHFGNSVSAIDHIHKSIAG